VKFSDHFSSLADEYAKYRPSYPDELFQVIAHHAEKHDVAWDCGTGTGQTAIKLARWFQRVIATDVSENQIRNAFPHPQVQYRVEMAEAPSLPTDSVDVATASTALHWFSLDAFFGQVRRVVRSGGLLVVWTYYLPKIDPPVDDVVMQYGAVTLAGHWDPQHRFVETEYRDLPFPFEEIPIGPFRMSTEWTLQDLRGFLASWSPVGSYRRANGQHPLVEVDDALRESWGHPEQAHAVDWEVHARLGMLP
jgi:SAM-dependent methyltransferase